MVVASATRSGRAITNRATLRGRYEQGYESTIRELKGSKSSKSSSTTTKGEGIDLPDGQGKADGQNSDEEAKDEDRQGETEDHRLDEDTTEKEERQVKEESEGKQGNGQGKVATAVVASSDIHGFALGLGTCGSVPSVAKGVYYGQVASTFRQSYGAAYLCDYDDCCASGCCYPLAGQGFINTLTDKWVGTAGCCSDVNRHCLGRNSTMSSGGL